MRFGSLFSGIEAVSVAWRGLAEPAYVSEIAAFPCEVLAYHYPDVPNLGNVWDDGFERRLAEHPVDVIISGPPCQSYSLAGHRRGTDDIRGRLTPRYFELATKLRVPTIIFENVPGVLSDPVFHGIVQGLGECGYRWAYRVLDAQYFGVPQHRRRVYLVANLEGRHPADVLFEEPPGHDGLEPQLGQRKAARLDPGVAEDHGRAVAFRGRNGRTKIELGDHLSYCLRASQGYADGHVLDRGRIRRLVPEEYEAIQGFPEGYTKIRPDTPDRPRYQAIGNSMAVPVVRWIGQRLFVNRQSA